MSQTDHHTLRRTMTAQSALHDVFTSATCISVHLVVVVARTDLRTHERQLFLATAAAHAAAAGGAGAAAVPPRPLVDCAPSPAGRSGAAKYGGQCASPLRHAVSFAASRKRHQRRRSYGPRRVFCGGASGQGGSAACSRGVLLALPCVRRSRLPAAAPGACTGPGGRRGRDGLAGPCR